MTDKQPDPQSRQQAGQQNRDKKRDQKHGKGAARMSPAARRKARVLAVQALYQWQLAASSLKVIEQEFEQDNDMTKVDRPYFKELLHRIPANVGELDDCLTPLLDRKRDELTPIELSIMRIGVYELLYRKDIPFKVVINEGVELSKKFGAADGHKYVNGVLDAFARSL